jgi:hypothetical protein
MSVLARLFTALLGLAVTACASRYAEPATISQHDFIDLQWRLTSAFFPVISAEGFLISFHSDGGLETQNLGLVNRWAFSNDVLRLYHNEQGVLDFRWLPTHGVFRSCSDITRPPFFVFPVGTSASEVQRIGCEHFPSAANQMRTDRATRAGERQTRYAGKSESQLGG